MTTFTTTIEIPVIVTYNIHPEERQTMSYPGCPVHIDEYDVSVQSDIETWIKAEHEDNLEQEIWDHAEAEKETAEAMAYDNKESRMREG